MKSSFVLLGLTSAQPDSTGLLQLRALSNLSIRVHDQAAPVGCEALVAPGFKFGVKVFPAGSSSSVDQCAGFSSTAAIMETVGVARKALLNEQFAVVKAKSSLSTAQVAVKGQQDLVTEAQANAGMWMTEMVDPSKAVIADLTSTFNKAQATSDHWMTETTNKAEKSEEATIAFGLSKNSLDACTREQAEASKSEATNAGAVDAATQAKIGADKAKMEKNSVFDQFSKLTTVDCDTATKLEKEAMDAAAAYANSIKAREVATATRNTADGVAKTAAANQATATSAWEMKEKLLAEALALKKVECTEARGANGAEWAAHSKKKAECEALYSVLLASTDARKKAESNEAAKLVELTDARTAQAKAASLMNAAISATADATSNSDSAKKFHASARAVEKVQCSEQADAKTALDAAIQRHTDADQQRNLATQVHLKATKELMDAEASQDKECKEAASAFAVKSTAESTLSDMQGRRTVATETVQMRQKVVDAHTTDVATKTKALVEATNAAKVAAEKLASANTAKKQAEIARSLAVAAEEIASEIRVAANMELAKQIGVTYQVDADHSKKSANLELANTYLDAQSKRLSTDEKLVELCEQKLGTGTEETQLVSSILKELDARITALTASKTAFEAARTAQQEASVIFKAAVIAKEEQDKMAREAQADLTRKETVERDAEAALSAAESVLANAANAASVALNGQKMADAYQATTQSTLVQVQGLLDAAKTYLEQVKAALATAEGQVASATSKLKEATEKHSAEASQCTTATARHVTARSNAYSLSMDLSTKEAIAKNRASERVAADAIYVKESEECDAGGRAAGLAQDKQTETTAKLATATETEKQRRTESSTADGIATRAQSSKDAATTSREAAVATEATDQKNSDKCDAELSAAWISANTTATAQCQSGKKNYLAALGERDSAKEALKQATASSVAAYTDLTVKQGLLTGAQYMESSALNAKDAAAKRGSDARTQCTTTTKKRDDAQAALNVATGQAAAAATALTTAQAALAKAQVAHKAKVAECTDKQHDYNIKQKAEENAFDAAKKAALELDCATIAANNAEDARNVYESGEHKDTLDALSVFQTFVSAAAADLKVATEASARAQQVLDAAEKKFALSGIDHNRLLCAEKACVFDCALASITNWIGNPLLKHGEALPEVSDADSSDLCKEHTVYNHCGEVCSGPPTCKYGVLSSKPSCTSVLNSIHTTPAITTTTAATTTTTKPCITTQGSLKAKGIFKFAIEGTSDIGAQGHQVKFMRGTKDMLAAGSAQYMSASKTFQDVAGMSTASDYLVSFAVVNKNGAIMNMQRSFNAYIAVQETLKGCPAILDISSIAGRSPAGLMAKSGDEMEAVFVVDMVGDSGVITPKTFKLKYSFKAMSGPM